MAPVELRRIDEARKCGRRRRQGSGSAVCKQTDRNPSKLRLRVIFDVSDACPNWSGVTQQPEARSAFRRFGIAPRAVASTPRLSALRLCQETGRPYRVPLQAEQYWPERAAI